MIIYKVTVTYIDSKNTYELWGKHKTKEEANFHINRAKSKAMFRMCEFHITEKTISDRPLLSL